MTAPPAGWAGVVPLRLEVLPPIADPRLPVETPMSDAVIELLRAGGR